MKAAGACRVALLRFKPPRLLGRDDFKRDHSEQGPPRIPSREALMALSKSLVACWADRFSRCRILWGGQGMILEEWSPNGSAYTNPKQLQCHHVNCQTCLVRLVVRDQQGQLVLTCPNCRQVTPVPANGVAGLQSEFNISHLLDVLEEHKRAKEGALYCADHQERELELYFDTCEKLICLQCTITEHNGHKYNLVKDVLEKSKQEIKASLTPAEEQLTAVGKALERVDTRKREILDQQATVEAKTNQYSQKLVETIKARTKEHISKLHHITEEKIRDLDSQREQMETIKTQLSSYLDMVGETLTTGSQNEVMTMKTAIGKQVKVLTASLQTDTHTRAYHTS